MEPAIISAAAALSGVLLAQVIGILHRRGEERRRRRSEVGAAVGPALSLILDATDQIRRGARSETRWAQQPDWVDLRETTWPAVRTLLLNQAAAEPGAERPSFYSVALRLQGLLASDDADADAALDAWDEAREQVIRVRDRALP